MMSAPATMSRRTRQPKLILPIACFRAVLLAPGPCGLLRLREDLRRLVIESTSRETGRPVNPTSNTPAATRSQGSPRFRSRTR